MRQPPRSHMPGFMCPSRPPNLQTGSEGHGLCFLRRRRGRQIGKQGKYHTASPSGLSHNCFAAWPAHMADKNACCERGRVCQVNGRIMGVRWHRYRDSETVQSHSLQRVVAKVRPCTREIIHLYSRIQQERCQNGRRCRAHTFYAD